MARKCKIRTRWSANFALLLHSGYPPNAPSAAVFGPPMAKVVYRGSAYSPPPVSSLTMLLTNSFASPNSIMVLSM